MTSRVHHRPNLFLHRRPSALRRLSLVGLAAMMAGGVGCASQGEYDGLYETNISLRNRNEELLRQIDQLEGENGRLLGSSGAAGEIAQELRSDNQRLAAENARLESDLRALGDRVASLRIEPLDATTDAALSELASSYPDLILYDPAQGMLRFSSDLTFASGSADVQAGAQSSLQALASVLNSASAGGYNVEIVGHTDAQRISARTAQRHPTNTHLSAHRAISVRRELVNLGVAPERMKISGWGEHRPVTANRGTGNTPQNRRVEVLISRG
ncbi:MAG: OmpA family protein [Planctomycetota bacterium]